MIHGTAKQVPGRLLVMAALVSAPGCASTPSDAPASLDGVYAFTARRGQGSFEGTISLAQSVGGYEGYLTIPDADLPLTRSSVDGPRATLSFEDDRITMVVTVVLEGNRLHGSWYTRRGGGSITATRVSTAWDLDRARLRRPGGPGPTGRPAS